MKRNEALNHLLNYPDSGVKEAVDAIQKEDAHMMDTLQRILDSLGQLRLDVKYLTFDLEATRRERDELKAKLGE